jgi:hypothetical protein
MLPCFPSLSHHLPLLHENEVERGEKTRAFSFTRSPLFILALSLELLFDFDGIPNRLVCDALPGFIFIRLLRALCCHRHRFRCCCLLLLKRDGNFTEREGTPTFAASCDKEITQLSITLANFMNFVTQ